MKKQPGLGQEEGVSHPGPRGWWRLRLEGEDREEGGWQRARVGPTGDQWKVRAETALVCPNSLLHLPSCISPPSRWKPCFAGLEAVSDSVIMALHA